MTETKEIFVTVEIPQEFIDAYMEFYKAYKPTMAASRAHISNLYKKYIQKVADYENYTNFIGDESDS